jgi:membrane protein
MKADDVPLPAAGVAFYGLLSLVPALVVLVSVYGLIADPEGIEDDIEDLLAAAPEEVQDLVTSQLSTIVESSPSSLRVGGAVVGVVVALWSVVWVIASVGFSLYTANFGRYNETYGALGAVIVVMLWLYISAWVVVVGAEINAELERRPAVESATGPSMKGGRRGADAAD